MHLKYFLTLNLLFLQYANDFQMNWKCQGSKNITLFILSIKSSIITTLHSFTFMQSLAVSTNINSIQVLPSTNRKWGAPAAIQRCCQGTVLVTVRPLVWQIPAAWNAKFSFNLGSSSKILTNEPTNQIWANEWTNNLPTYLPTYLT